MSNKFEQISRIQIEIFFRLFNRGGYVLNFSTPDFDRFTLGSIGEELCSKYRLSKGKSLERYCFDAEEINVIKLLSDLLEYYEFYYSEETGNENNDFHKYYRKCKEIILSIKTSKTPYSISSQNLKQNFSSSYLDQQIDLMFKAKDEHPADSIGKAKELIESCCKTILIENNQDFKKDIDIGVLVKQTMKFLKVHSESIDESLPEAETVKKILGNLSGIATGVAELRNEHGTGHGKPKTYKGLTSRHAELAIGSSITLVKYLWDTYEWKKENNKL